MGVILYVVRYFPTLTETFVHDEVRGLAGEGIGVELAAYGTRGDPGAESLGVPVHQPPHRFGWLRWLPRLMREWLRRPAWVSRRVLWMAALLRQQKIRRVHIHFAGEAAEWTATACRRVGVPYGLTVHAVDLFRPRPGLPAVLAGAQPLLTISEWNRRWIEEKHGVAAVVLPSGVALGEPGRPADPPRVVAVGRWVPKKGFALLLQAWKILDRHAELHLVSDAPAGTGGPGVVVHGLRPRREVQSLIGSAAVFVLPCQRAPDGDMDGIPVVILEAMAQGVPVISTRVSGIPEVVDATVGWLVEPGDTEALVGALREALDQPEEARGRGAAGRARLRAQGRSAAQHLAGLRRLLGA